MQLPPPASHLSQPSTLHTLRAPCRAQVSKPFTAAVTQSAWAQRRPAPCFRHVSKPCCAAVAQAGVAQRRPPPQETQRSVGHLACFSHPCWEQSLWRTWRLQSRSCFIPVTCRWQPGRMHSLGGFESVAPRLPSAVVIDGVSLRSDIFGITNPDPPDERTPGQSVPEVRNSGKKGAR